MFLSPFHVQIDIALFNISFASNNPNWKQKKQEKSTATDLMRISWMVANKRIVAACVTENLWIPCTNFPSKRSIVKQEA